MGGAPLSGLSARTPGRCNSTSRMPNGLPASGNSSASNLSISLSFLAQPFRMVCGFSAAFFAKRSTSKGRGSRAALLFGSASF
jgi:hypothetical protein